MSSKHRKFRKKEEEPSTDLSEDALAGGEAVKSLPMSRKEKKEKPKKVSLLSFDEEEGGSPVKARNATKERVKPKVRPNLQGLGIKEEAKPTGTQQSGAGEN